MAELAATPVLSDLSGYEQRLLALQQRDDDKIQLFRDLLKHLDTVSKELTATKALVDRSETTNDALVTKLRATKQDLMVKEQNEQRNAFVSVLLDGDHMLFEDQYLKKGEAGGREAAQKLRGAVMEHLSTVDGLPEYKLVVQVFANVRGLAQVCLENHIISELSGLDDFIRGFNMSDPLFDFVDAGSGKECADAKLSASFIIHEADVHCRHILFGASGDNGYARLLGPYAGKTRSANRITMVQGPPFERELAALSKEFPCTSFRGVVRHSKLIRQQAHVIAPGNPAPRYSAVASAAPPNGSSMGQATPTAVAPLIRRDGAGRRLDPYIEHRQDIVSLLKGRKMCNEYHVRGSCPFANCVYKHGDRLRGEELQAVRFIARLSACDWGPLCDRDDCIKGHRCPRLNCDSPFCLFQWHR